jgi:hypothetical protein
MNKDEMDRIYNTCGGKIKCISNFGRENLRGRCNIGGLGVEQRITLGWICNRKDMNVSFSLSRINYSGKLIINYLGPVAAFVKTLINRWVLRKNQGIS